MLALGWGEYRGPRALVYVAKPLATLAILALAALAAPQAEPGVARWILLGLAFSLAGDVLLMLPSDRFAAGLASFLRRAPLLHRRLHAARRASSSRPGRCCRCWSRSGSCTAGWLPGSEACASR